MYEYIDQQFKSTLDSSDIEQLRSYVKFRGELNDKINDVFDKYRDELKSFDKKSNKARSVLLANFEHLENDETFIMAMETVDEIQNEADQLIKPVIKRYFFI